MATSFYSYISKNYRNIQYDCNCIGYQCICLKLFLILNLHLVKSRYINDKINKYIIKSRIIDWIIKYWFCRIVPICPHIAKINTVYIATTYTYSLMNIPAPHPFLSFNYPRCSQVFLHVMCLW